MSKRNQTGKKKPKRKVPKRGRRRK